MNELESLLNLSSPILIAVFMTVFGKAFKSIERVPDKWIPMLMGLIGVPMFMSVQGWNVRNAVLGFIIGWASVGANQTWRQLTGYGQDKQNNENKP